MTQFLLILFCLGAGYVLRRFEVLPKNAPQVFNAFIVYISLPALIFFRMPEFLASEKLDATILVPVSMAWIQFALAFAIFYPLSRYMNWSRATTGAIILTSGLGNTSFVGFPLLEALLGPESIRIGIIVDQAGSFFVLSTLGVMTASAFSEKRATSREVVLRIIKYPPFLSLVVSFALFLIEPEIFTPFKPALESLGNTLVPIALISVGCQISFSLTQLKRRFAPLSFGLTHKLILTPAILAFFYLQVVGASGEIAQVTILESAMAPMITAAIVAADFQLDTELANLMVGLGIPISLITVTLWNYFMF